MRIGQPRGDHQGLDGKRLRRCRPRHLQQPLGAQPATPAARTGRGFARDAEGGQGRVGGLPLAAEGFGLLDERGFAAHRGWASAARIRRPIHSATCGTTALPRSRRRSTPLGIPSATLPTPGSLAHQSESSKPPRPANTVSCGVPYRRREGVVNIASRLPPPISQARCQSAEPLLHTFLERAFLALLLSPPVDSPPLRREFAVGLGQKKDPIPDMNNAAGQRSTWNRPQSHSASLYPHSRPGRRASSSHSPPKKRCTRSPRRTNRGLEEGERPERRLALRRPPRFPSMPARRPALLMSLHGKPPQMRSTPHASLGSARRFEPRK